MLQMTVSYTVFVARQSYLRNFCDGLGSLHHHQVVYSKLVRQKQLQKALLLVLVSVSDSKCACTSWYFIITNLHTELVQVKISHGMNSPASETVVTACFLVGSYLLFVYIITKTCKNIMTQIQNKVAQ